ncbi:MAG: GAF domain-containing protein [Alphaproteobacteria bacterium]|nr:GAF domain-containing protein [Alphaproteobacteria bacterium]
MSAPGPAAPPSGSAIPAAAAQPRGRLFRKYVLSFIGVVSLVLLASGLLDGWFSYRETRTTLALVQDSKAEAAAQRIEQFIAEIERQIGWTTHAQWAAGTVDQRRFDYVRLLRQVPAITELVQIDATGKEQLKVSRLAMDVVGSGADLSAEARFVEAKQRRVWYGPVYFRKESEPYMTIAVAHGGRAAGVTAAEVNLKLIWDVVTSIRLGQRGYAYVVDREGRLIAHPDISLVLRNTDLARSAQVVAARDAVENRFAEAQAIVVPGFDGRSVFSAHATIPQLGWIVFVESPIQEALAPLYATMWRTAGLLLAGLAIAALGGIFFARRMLAPVRALTAGAARLGVGDLGHRIDVRTGDEIQSLADSFNEMAGQLQQSYAGLEQKVADRTRELQESLEQQTATSDVLRVISASPGALAPVFDQMLESATRICAARFGIVFRYGTDGFRVEAMRNVPPAYAEVLRSSPPYFRNVAPDSAFGRMLARIEPVHVEDLRVGQAYADRMPIRTDLVDLGQARTFLAVPLVKDGKLIGAFALYRDEVKGFTPKQIELVAGFSDQAVIAMENVRLFDEVQARTRELAQSVEELRALGEVGQAVNSTLDAARVLDTIITKAVEISGTEAGVIYGYSTRHQAFRMRASAGGTPELTEAIRQQKLNMQTPLGDAARTREPVQITDLTAVPDTPVVRMLLAAGYRSLLIVPLIGRERVIGALVMRRKQTGLFPSRTVDLIKTLAAQSVGAIQNARLFGEIEEKSRQLELASQHKSQFLANMSHELRTPLNAVLGYAELMADGIYGDLSDKAQGVLARIQTNGKHLLGLINDVLDLSKIEAGQFTLANEPYSVGAVVQAVIAATESLASNKAIRLGAEIEPDLPPGQGDERRLTQVFLNIVGNAIKFTDQGEVVIAARGDGETFEIAVRDTGPGIAPENQAKIFGEFQQVDDSSTRKKGGTGLGLAISKKIVEMHGGTISVESELGKGSIFRVRIPMRAAPVKEAAQ